MLLSAAAAAALSPWLGIPASIIFASASTAVCPAAAPEYGPVEVRGPAQPQDREEPRVGLAAAGDALLEQLDELVGELVEVHQDGLLHLQGLELLLGNLHAMEKERIRIARHLDAKHLRGERRDAGVKTRVGVKSQRTLDSCHTARFRE